MTVWDVVSAIGVIVFVAGAIGMIVCGRRRITFKVTSQTPESRVLSPSADGVILQKVLDAQQE